MNTNPGMLTRIYNWFHGEITGQVEERFVVIPPADPNVKREVIPFERHKEVPDLGPDRGAMIKKAERLFADDDKRLKWLLSIYQMRRNNQEWIMQPIPGHQMRKFHAEKLFKKYPKWGVVNEFDGIASNVVVQLHQRKAN